MSIRAKTKRRLAILLSCTVLAGSVGVGGYGLRMRQLRDRSVAARAEGMEALKAEDYVQAFHKIGLYLQRYRDDAEALQAYARARRQVPENNGSHMTQAIGVLRRVLDLEPQRMEARRALLELYMEAGFNTETVETAGEILKQIPDDPGALHAKAVALLRMRKYDAALVEAQRCNEVAPLDLKTQVLTLAILSKRGTAAEQIVGRVEALRKDRPDETRFEILQSIAYWIVGDAAKAMEWARTAASRDVADAAAAEMLVDHLGSLGAYGEAMKVLEQVARSGGSKVRKLYYHRLWQSGRYEAAATELASLDPKDRTAPAELLGLRALALSRTGRNAEVGVIVDALSERKSDRMALAWGRVLRAALAEPKSDAREIIAACAEGNRIAQHNPYFLYFAGDAYEQMGEHEIAVQQWKQASAGAPAWPLPLIRCAEVLTRMGRFTEAMQAGHAARLRAPEDPAALASLAVACGMVIDGQDARGAAELLELVKKVQRLRPREEQTLPLMVRLLSRGGNTAAAKATVDDVLNAKPAVSESLLLRLAATCRDAKLPMEGACYRASQAAHGMTPELALAQARSLWLDGRKDEGTKFLESARRGGKGEGSAWDLAWARYLDLAGDPRARDAWVALAESRAGDAQIQWMALAARSVQSDHEFVGRTIDRLRDRIGQEGLSWRLMRARWLLDGKPSEKETAEAVSILNDVSRWAPELLGPRLLLAGSLERIGNISGAVEQLTTALNLRPDSAPIALDLARLLQTQGEFDRARDVLNKLLDLPGLGADQSRAAARLLARQGDGGRALKLLESIKGTDNDSPEPDAALAALYQQQNEPEKAEAIYRKLLEKPDAAVVQLAAGFYASRNQRTEAEKALALLDGLKLEPGVKQILLGDYHQRCGEMERAVAQYRSAAQLAPQNATAWRQLIACQFLAGNAADAIASAETAAKAVPGEAGFEAIRANAGLIKDVENPWIRPLLATLTQPGNDSAPALELLRQLDEGKRKQMSASEMAAGMKRLADRHPRHLTVQNTAAQLCGLAGGLEDAATLASRAMHSFPNAAEPAQLAAGALASLGRWSEALGAAQQWRQRSTSQPLGADVMIATCQLGLGKPQEALRQMQPYLKSAQEKPESMPRVLTLCAQAQLMTGDSTAAGQILRPLIGQSPQWRGVWMRLASSQVRNLETASKWLEEAGSAIPAANAEERLALAVAWHDLARRSNDEACRDRARTALRSAASAAANGSMKSETLFSLALMHEMDGDLKAAESAYRRAMAASAQIPAVQNNLAMVLATQGEKLDEALQLATMAVKASPRSGMFLDTLALVQMKLKNLPAAMESISAAIRCEPDNLEYRVRLVQMLAESGQNEKARAALNQLEGMQPDPSRLSEQARVTLDALRRSLRPETAATAQ